ncbi:MAG: hypothetical protein FJX23_03800 [Alphaproteobacteria bacterium]|nr:hypothetical protein [Alphaproteobacteria bacterium]
MAENPTRALSRVQNPDIEPLTLAEAKLYLRVDGSDDDLLISALIRAGREAAEEFLRKSLAVQEWKITYEDYAPLKTPLPRGPVQEILSVKRITRNGDEVAMAEHAYHLNARHDMLHFETIPMSFEVSIHYRTGYGDEGIPASVRQGMLIHIAEMYDNRAGAAAAMPSASISLYKPHREIGF